MQRTDTKTFILARACLISKTGGQKRNRSGGCVLKDGLKNVPKNVRYIFKIDHNSDKQMNFTFKPINKSID